jgi:hypothetical protein
MSDRRQYRRRQPRGTPRPVSPEWQLSQREVWAMLSRPHFSRFAVVHVRCRQLVTDDGQIVVVRNII